MPILLSMKTTENESLNLADFTNLA